MKAWENFLNNQEKLLGIETVDKWLRSLRVIEFDACNLYLEAKDAFHCTWFEEHVRKNLKTHFVNNNSKEIKVHLLIKGDHKPSPLPRKNQPPSPSQKQEALEDILFDELDPLATFDHFLEFESNILAHKLLCKVTNYDPISKTFIPTNGDLAAFNPIYLFGASGAGKTHLLMATAHALKNRQLKVLYVRADTFTEQVIKAIRSGEMSRFRQACRNIDVLLVDDVHLFSRKAATQEEFFHTFNTLHLVGKQIILSANCSPAELQYIEPRLVSRFEWGIVLPLDSFDEADLPKLLNKKAEALGSTLHPKVEEFLLATFTSNTKSLLHALETLILRQSLRSAQQKGEVLPITVQSCRHLLKDLIEEEQKQALTSEKIVHNVAEYFGIKSQDILGKSQNRECTLPRQLAMYFCRNRLKMPFKKIGDLFCRDHSTVMSSVKLIEKNIQQDDKDIAAPYLTILKQLNRT